MKEDTVYLNHILDCITNIEEDTLYSAYRLS